MTTPDEARGNDVEQWRHSHEFHLDSLEQERATSKVLWLTAGAMVLEIAAGFLFGSMALLADGWHMATHATAFGVTLFAYRYARAHADDPSYSFGTGKVSILGGFASAIALLMVAVLMVAESVHRFVDPQAIRFNAALVVAAFGLAVNLVSAWLLHEQHHRNADDHNMRSAYLHVVTDALTSVLALVALLFGKFLGWHWMDPMMGIVGAALIARWSVELVRDSGGILLDGSAGPATRERIVQALEAGGENVVTDLHVWKVGPRDYAAIISLGTRTPRGADYYKGLIGHLGDVSHVSVEVNVIDDEASVAGAAMQQ
ncbi:MAG: cation diffusion facilitator family transporter [Gammaproteobacteria bacterium]